MAVLQDLRCAGGTAAVSREVDRRAGKQLGVRDDRRASLDPTPAALLRERAPGLLAWAERMLDPKAAGDFESLAALTPTLRPLLAGPVARWFLPWSDANAREIEAGREEFEVELCGQRWSQKPQKYHAKSLAELRRKYAALAERERSACDPLLRETGCLDWLR